MDELRPCPFCGGEARVVGKPHEAVFCVGCGDDTCLGFSGLGWLYGTEEEAAAAWNRRAERTCHTSMTRRFAHGGAASAAVLSPSATTCATARTAARASRMRWANDF